MNAPSSFCDPLPYRADAAAFFERVADRPWAVFLDSGGSGGTRYDIIAAEPAVTLTTRGERTEIRDTSGRTRSSGADPFALVREALGAAVPTPNGLPFAGGALGYFGYDLARRIEQLPSLAIDGEGLPEMAIGIYDWAVVLDHVRREAWLAGGVRGHVTQEHRAALLGLFSEPVVPRQAAPFVARSPVHSNFSAGQYAAAFARVMTYLRDGDCYQVNLAQRFEAQVNGDPWRAYLALRQQSPAPFGAFLNLPEAQLLCNSPERFLQVRAGAVETRPIKGTRRRDADPARDAALRRELAESRKDRAENLMIVDLLRNDLGRNCAVGSVSVPELFGIESFATVHHLVSTVTGTLARNRHALDLLRGCFPGGSITGAPKLRAMAIIEELEPHRRGVYCGAIGYIGFDGAMDTNIAIRTLVVGDGTARWWAGGGIVADSDREAEYRETFDKAAALAAIIKDS